MSSIIRPEVKCAFKALNQHLKTMFFHVCLANNSSLT